MKENSQNEKDGNEYDQEVARSPRRNEYFQKDQSELGDEGVKCSRQSFVNGFWVFCQFGHAFPDWDSVPKPCNFYVGQFPDQSVDEVADFQTAFVEDHIEEERENGEAKGRANVVLVPEPKLIRGATDQSANESWENKKRKPHVPIQNKRIKRNTMPPANWIKRSSEFLELK